MSNKQNWFGDTGRIGGKSFFAAVIMHFLLVSLLFFAPWQRSPVVSYEVFAIQLVDVPPPPVRREAPVEQETVVEKPPAEAALPVPRPAQTTPAVAPRVRQQAPSRERPSFSETQFREQLASRLESIPDSRVETESRQQPSRVDIERVESVYADVIELRADVSIPQWYLLHAKKIIKGNWHVDDYLRQRSAFVSFRVFRDGRIENISVETRSGNTAFDRAAADAVRRTGRLDPFPSEIIQPYLDLVIEFKTEG